MRTSLLSRVVLGLITLGTLLFQSVYWHSLLPGRDLPGLTSNMPTAGKRLDSTTKEA